MSPTIADARPVRSRVALIVLVVASLIGLVPAASAGASDAEGDDVVVVANRGSGDVSIIATGSLDVHDIDLPGDAEPMYVSHDPRHDRVLVGDRASSSVVAFDEDSFEVVAQIEVGDGVFHQWLDPGREQLWVVGDTSRTVTVVDTRRLTTVVTIDIPADLVERGGVPHDVFVRGNHAFVSILGLDDGSGVVVQYSTTTFAETGRVTTGGDPHLFVRGARLHVASQAGSTVSTYVASTLRPLASLDLPAAHGIYVTARGEVLVTNIAGGGVDGLWSLNRRLDVRDVADTAVAVPHNITVDRSHQVFVTHSGATADQVSVVEHERHGFGATQLVTVGSNPFGLAFVDR